VKTNPILTARTPFEGVKAALEQGEAEIRQLQQTGDIRELSAEGQRYSRVRAVAQSLQPGEFVGGFLKDVAPADQGRFLLELVIARFGDVPSVQAQRKSADTMSEILGLFAQLPEAHATLEAHIESIRAEHNHVTSPVRRADYANDLAYCGFAPKQWVDDLAEELMRPLHF